MGRFRGGGVEGVELAVEDSSDVAHEGSTEGARPKHRLRQADIAQEQFAAAATKALAFERVADYALVGAVHASG
jgi:hypothetical protein